MMEVPKHFIRGSEAWEQALDYWRGNPPKTLSTGWPALDFFFKMSPGQLTILGGIANHGKSTFADALMVNMNADHGWRWAVFSPENHPHGVHAWRLIEKYIGKPLMKGPSPSVDETEMDAAGEWMDDTFSFLTPITVNVDGLIEAIRTAHAERPLDGVVIDPWNEVEHGRPDRMTETEYISESLSKFRRLGRELGLHIIIAVHPKKLERDKEGKYPVPTAWDLAGSAHWRNKADNIITYWRDVAADDNTAELHIQKVRFYWNGRVSPDPIGLLYEPLSGTFTAALDANKNNQANWYVSPYRRKK